MSKVQVRFIGPIRRPWPEVCRTVEIPAQCDVEDLLETIGFTTSELLRIVLMVNGSGAELSRMLADGDQVDLALLLGGG